MQTQAAITNAPVDGLPMDVLTAGTRVDVLGTFGDALFVRTADGRAGWIPRGAGA